MKAKKQKPKKTNPFQKRNSLIYSHSMPKNFEEVEQRKNITNTELFNFNPTGRIRQQAQQQ